MSTTESTVSEPEAKKKAQKVLAFQVGNLPHIGEALEIGPDHLYPIYIRHPRVIFDDTREVPTDVRFMSKKRVGTICVDEEGKVSRTRLPRINKRIRDVKRRAINAVQQALVRSSARRFSRLPFPTHRYTPILDILSHLLIEGPITQQMISDITDDQGGNYREYVEQLQNVDLVRIRNNQVEPDDILIEIEAQESEHPEQLNMALAHFFREGADNTETIQRILGPYLILSAYYYKRALELDSTPKVTKDEFKEEIERFYSGKNSAQKKFKLSRYLIQLEEVNILDSSSDTNQNTWVAVEGIKEGILAENDLINPVSGVFA